MQSNVEKAKNSQVKITIELTEEETKKHLLKAAEQVSKMIKVPGFREGKAPYDVLKKHVRDGAIEGQMLDIALPITYSAAVKEHDLKVISRPKVNVLQDNPLKYEATVAIYPEVKVSGYDKVKIKVEEPKVEDEDVEKVIKDIQMRKAKYVKVDRVAKKGDRVEIDFNGFDEGGAPLENTQSKHHPVIIGDGTLVSGFEDELIGVKKGDEKEFTVKFPKDYFHKPFQNKKVKFQVLVHEVEEVQPPEMNEEFIKTISNEAKNEKELRDQIRQNLEDEKKHSVKVQKENQYLDKVADLTKVDIPEILVEEEIDAMLEEFQNELSQQGVTIQQYLEQAKKEMEDLREMRKKEAEKRLKLRFGLQEIFKNEKIEATEEDLKKEIDHIKGLYPEAEKDKIEKEYKDGSYLRRRLENKIRMEKLFAAYLPQ